MLLRRGSGITKMETDSVTTRRKWRKDKGALLSGDRILPKRRGFDWCWVVINDCWRRKNSSYCYIAKIQKATLFSANARVTGSSEGATKAAATVGSVTKHHDSTSFSLSRCISISLSLLSPSLSPSPSPSPLYLSIFLYRFIKRTAKTKQKQQQHR